MGEYVRATITVRSRDVYEFQRVAFPGLSWSNFWDQWSNHWPEGANLITFCDDQANYGDFGFEADLQRAGIPYDKTFAAGPDWSDGEEFFRPGHEVWIFYKEPERATQMAFVERLRNCENMEQVTALADEIAAVYDVPPLAGWVDTETEGEGDAVSLP